LSVVSLGVNALEKDVLVLVLAELRAVLSLQCRACIGVP